MKTPVLLLVGAVVLTAGALLPKVANHPSDSGTIPQEAVSNQVSYPAQTEPEPSEPPVPEPLDVAADEPKLEIGTDEIASAEPEEAATIKSAEFTKRIQTITSRYSLGLQDIARLIQGGIDKQVILAYIQSSRVPFAPTSKQIVQLHQMGASPEIITAIINHGIELRTQQAQAFKEQQERLVQQRQEAIQAAQAAYAAEQNRRSQFASADASAQGSAYNNGIGNGANNNNYTVFPGYTYAVIPQVRGRNHQSGGSAGRPNGTYPQSQPPYRAPTPNSNFKYASTFRYALPNSSYRSPEGYTAPLPKALRDRLP